MYLLKIVEAVFLNAAIYDGSIKMIDPYNYIVPNIINYVYKENKYRI